LLLVGHFASGKSTVAKQLANRLDCKVIEVGDIVRNSAKAVGESAFRHAEQVLASARPLTFAYQASEQINSVRGPVVVVGIRTPHELSLLKKVRTSVVVALDASPEVRKSRWQERQANGSRIPEVSWEERDRIERSWGLDEVVQDADVVVDANRPLSIVVDAVERAWRSLSLELI
jgi:dephospho-CoA kinase